MKIAIGCDHAGVDLKYEILPTLKELSIEWEDVGTNEDLSVDYPDFGEKVSECFPPPERVPILSYDVPDGGGGVGSFCFGCPFRYCC